MILLNKWMYEKLKQMAVAVKKILYAVDAKESALSEAQEYIQQSVNASTDPESENEP